MKTSSTEQIVKCLLGDRSAGVVLTGPWGDHHQKPYMSVWRAAQQWARLEKWEKIGSWMVDGGFLVGLAVALIWLFLPLPTQPYFWPGVLVAASTLIGLLTFTVAAIWHLCCGCGAIHDFRHDINRLEELLGVPFGSMLVSTYSSLSAKAREVLQGLADKVSQRQEEEGGPIDSSETCLLKAEFKQAFDLCKKFKLVEGDYASFFPQSVGISPELYAKIYRALKRGGLTPSEVGILARHPRQTSNVLLVCAAQMDVHPDETPPTLSAEPEK